MEEKIKNTDKNTKVEEGGKQRLKPVIKVKTDRFHHEEPVFGQQ